MLVPVATSAQSAALDAACIAAGTPSRQLMQRAGRAAATEILERCQDILSRGVAIFSGSGNNGGDAWVVAANLAAAGITVRVFEAAAPSTPDASAEKEAALSAYQFDKPTGKEGVVVDGLLGTGSKGSPRAGTAAAVSQIDQLRSGGAYVVALDLPSGLDATTGASDGSVRADLTLSFGSVKRGHLFSRSCCGTIAVLDIGLNVRDDAPLPMLIDATWVMRHVPAIPFDAHKGTRGRIAIVGGELGMIGAVALAAEGARRSGAGLVRAIVPPASVVAIQSAAPHATAAPWPDSAHAWDAEVGSWAHAMIVGPGMGTSEAARRILSLMLTCATTPVVVDADAINICGNIGRVAEISKSRKTVLTPHAAEMGRLTGTNTADVLANRFELAAQVARDSGAVTLLKGVPTVIASPDGRTCVSATGSPVLAAGGSGDILAGILGTLLAQIGDPFVAASCAAWIHGRSGEIATQSQRVRGRTLEHVLEALSGVWSLQAPRLREGVMAELQAVVT